MESKSGPPGPNFDFKIPRLVLRRRLLVVALLVSSWFVLVGSSRHALRYECVCFLVMPWRGWKALDEIRHD